VSWTWNKKKKKCYLIREFDLAERAPWISGNCGEVTQPPTSQVTCGDGQKEDFCNECPANEEECTSGDCKFEGGKCEPKEVKLKAVSAWQSSTHRFYHARYCIDGSPVKQCDYCLCHTTNGASTYPWIVVDFGKTVHVGRVVFDDYGTGFLGQLRMLNSRPSPNGGYLLEDGELFAKIDKPTTTHRWEAGEDGKFVAGRYLVVQERFAETIWALNFYEITAFGYV